MAPEVTYEWYAKSFGQALSEDEFAAALPEASARVRARCACHRLDELDERSQVAYKRAVCIACELVDDPQAVSWRAGKASEEYADAASMGVDAAIERELSGSALSSCWV